MGPLHGIKVLEFEAIGGGPFAGMVLADMGADVIVVDRPADPGLGIQQPRDSQVMMRGKRSVTLDLKSPDGLAAALELIGRADALIEGFRPGVMERLGLGPEIALARNPRLVYGRMTGWGQDGPMADRAGHDINYIALAGVLAAFGRPGQPPVMPLNLVGDFGGGGMLLGFGIAVGLVESLRSGQGQVVDAAMVEGASLLSAMFAGMLANGTWKEERGANILDTGAPWYEVYETRDAQYVSIGSIEPKFYDDLLGRLGLAGESLPKQMDTQGWPVLREKFAAVFRTRTREEWNAVFATSDACYAPVLTWSEAKRHPHNVARGSFVTVGGIEQAAPAPRFSRTKAEVRRAPPQRAEGGSAALAEWGFDAGAIARLRALGLGAQ